MRIQKMAKSCLSQTLLNYPFVSRRVSQQMAFVSWQLLHPRYEDIFKMLQELADAGI